jgi:hypothetical protein
MKFKGILEQGIPLWLKWGDPWLRVQLMLHGLLHQTGQQNSSFIISSFDARFGPPVDS